MTMSIENNQSKTETLAAVASSDLLAAVKLALDNWEDMRASSRQPMGHYLLDPRNELKVFAMVISLNNLQKAYDKAANNVLGDSDQAAK
jgi:hypothetical protein